MKIRRQGRSNVTGFSTIRPPNDPLLPFSAQFGKPRLPSQDLLVQPAVENTAPEAPLFAQFHPRNAPFLRPFVDRMGRETEVGRDFLQGEDVVLRLGPPRIGHRQRGGRWRESRTDSGSCGNMSCSERGCGDDTGFASPVSNLFTA